MGQVARAFGHGDESAEPGLGRDVVGVAVDGGGEIFPRLLARRDADDGGVAAGAGDGADLDHVVVLAIDPALGGEVGRGEEAGQDVGEIVRLADGVEVQHLPRVEVGGAARLALVERRFVGELACGDFCDDFAVVLHAHEAVVGHAANEGAGEVPLLENVGHRFLVAPRGR